MAVAASLEVKLGEAIALLALAEDVGAAALDLLAQVGRLSEEERVADDGLDALLAVGGDPPVALVALALDGGDGNDALIGGPKDDVLHGGPGNDKLNGGFGTNRVTCGPGIDTVINSRGDQVAADCERAS